MRTLALSCFILTASVACQKVPLRENGAQFAFTAAHWFGNEKTQYIFFSVQGLRAGQAVPSWPGQFELKVDGASSAIPELIPASEGFGKLDFSKAVHRHQILNCGEGTLCGSFSFHAETPARGLALRYRYHESSTMGVTGYLPNSVHPVGEYSDAQSVFVYGVFNKDNGRMQVRTHDNFGYPDNEQIKQFGMSREFRISEVALVDLTEIESKKGNKLSSAPRFPSEDCSVVNQNRNVSAFSHRMSAGESWWPGAFDPESSEGAACFKFQALDQTGKKLYQVDAVARRNPVLVDDALVIRSPLKEARKIPIVLTYCPGRPDSDSLVSPLFLEYQKFILGSLGSKVDACFAVGEEARFIQELGRVLTEKIAAARATDTGGQDFIFTIVINHRMSAVVRKFHQIIQSEISKRVAQEIALISPRLVGAFVYDSQPGSVRDLPESPGIVWCPRADKLKDGQVQDANCTTQSSAGGELKLGPLNFLIPMGPFPTLDTFVSYHERYGDKGQSQNPQLVVRSVQTNENSASGAGGLTYTFFDGQRTTIQGGGGLKFCRERDEDYLLGSLVFRTQNSTGETKVLTVDQIQSLVATTSVPIALDVGLQWDHPFLGGISFDVPVKGKVFDLIPISRTFRDSQKVGDAKWQKTSWKAGALMQKCLRHCTHPFFDEAGVYQLNQAWNHSYSCPSPKPAEPKP